MKVTIFQLENPIYSSPSDPFSEVAKAIYHTPTLPAYAIIDSRLDMKNSIHVPAGYIPMRYNIDKDKVITEKSNSMFGASDEGTLTVYHNGICDYKLLFPHVNPRKLKNETISFFRRGGTRI
ncbi:hypothetical protein [Teredinibacter haidensis]|uniref:hypothetical protein n=1 Tax=Teredinibacter haidensis TaxID=2731755 RepID=UPI000948BF29|nr:hypothetical protein [Teredinibacter haidensis]